RGWDFVSPGRGDVDFEDLFRALNRIGYGGPLAIEWEDSGMDRGWGGPDAVAFVRRADFAPAEIALDGAVQKAGSWGAGRGTARAASGHELRRAGRASVAFCERPLGLGRARWADLRSSPLGCRNGGHLDELGDELVAAGDRRTAHDSRQGIRHGRPTPRGYGVR